MRNITVLSAIVAFSPAAYADAPQVPTAAPYIVLSDNLNEPNGYGFCLDTHGRGKSDLMQTHSCKPAKDGEPRDYSGNDTRFTYDADTGRVASYAFEGLCMQALIASDTTVFALLECSDHPRQKFAYESTDQTLRLDENQDLCVSVATETAPAGPWVKRSLALQNCAEIEASLRQWTVVAE